MKNKIHSLIIEGILFCGSGIALLSYSLVSYGKAFNKDWGQSPYLFPMLVGLALIGLSIWLMGEGVLEMKRADGPCADGKSGRTGAKQTAAGDYAAKKRSAEKIRWVVIALILCGIYYMALAWLKIPYITIGIFTFLYTFSTFEVVTVVFLAAMMAFMGVRKPTVLVFVPLGTTLFLSIAFRTMLHVLLP